MSSFSDYFYGQTDSESSSPEEKQFNSFGELFEYLLKEDASSQEESAEPHTDSFNSTETGKTHNHYEDSENPFVSLSNMFQSLAGETEKEPEGEDKEAVNALGDLLKGIWSDALSECDSVLDEEEFGESEFEDENVSTSWWDEKTSEEDGDHYTFSLEGVSGIDLTPDDVKVYIADDNSPDGNEFIRAIIHQELGDGDGYSSSYTVSSGPDGVFNRDKLEAYIDGSRFVIKAVLQSAEVQKEESKTKKTNSGVTPIQFNDGTSK